MADEVDSQIVTQEDAVVEVKCGRAAPWPVEGV